MGKKKGKSEAESKSSSARDQQQAPVKKQQETQKPTGSGDAPSQMEKNDPKHESGFTEVRHKKVESKKKGKHQKSEERGFHEEPSSSWSDQPQLPGKSKERGLAPKQSKGPPQGQSKGPPQGQSKGPPQGQSKGPRQGQSRDPPQGQSRDPPQGQSRDPPQDWWSGTPQGQSRDPPQGQSREPSQDWWSGTPQGQSRGPPQGQSRGPPQGQSRGPPQGQSRGPPQDRSRGPPQDQSRGPPQDQSRGPPQDQSRGPAQDRSRGPPQVHSSAQGKSLPQEHSSAWDKSSPKKQSTWVKSSFHEQTRSLPQKHSSTLSKSPTEEAHIENKSKDKSQLSQQLVTPGFREYAPRISAKSKSGRPIKVYVNFFSLYITDPKIVIYHHDVSVVPEKPKYLYRHIWNAFAAEHFPKRIVVFDGSRSAYSKNALLDKLSLTSTVTIKNPETGKLLEYSVTIKEVRKVNLTIFDNYRQKMLTDTRKKILPESEATVIETILKHKAANNFIEFKGVFIPKGRNRVSEPLSDRVDLCKGYFQTVFLGYKPYVNFDIKLRPLYRDIPVVKVIESFRNRRTNEINFEDVSCFLKTAKIMYKLPNDPEFFQVFRVNKLVGDPHYQTFTNQEGETISVYDYFYKEKKYQIKYPNYPLLWVGPIGKTIYIPAELCTIMPNQLYKGPLDPQETRIMVDRGTTNARLRAEKVMTAFRSAEYDRDPCLKEFGINVCSDMEKITARILDPPYIKTSTKIEVTNGTWKSRDFLQPMSINKWCILNLDKYVRKESLSNLQILIKSTGNKFKMKIGDPARAPIEGDPSFAGLRRAFSQLTDMNIVFVVISDMKGLYSKVKTICETQEGILTQCIRSKTMSQEPGKLAHTMENILLKVNAKLGGKNHSLDVDSIPSSLHGYVMVVGADVTHPAPGSKGPSVAAVAVSCDPAAFQYGITTKVQIGEIIKELDVIIENHLKIFYRLRKHYPDKIIFFRDGVSEGEMPQVFDTEVTAIKRACKNLCEPKITFIVVTKRHHTRFYPSSKLDETGKNYNVPVGTCVDTDVVHPRDLEFYLVSHSSGLGTARPTKYRLLYDDNFLTDDELEKLAYYLCHLFSRCNKSVSYPSPTYNAHLAAFRARAYLEALNVRNSEELDMIQSKMKDNISALFPMFFV